MNKILLLDLNGGEDWHGTQKILDTYGKKYYITVHRPYLDDWNDVLKNYRRNLEGKLPEVQRAEKIPMKSKEKQLGVAI